MMRSIVRYFLFFLALLCVVWGGEKARADYGMPPVEAIFGGEESRVQILSDRH